MRTAGGSTDATCDSVVNIRPTPHVLCDVRSLLEANEIYSLFYAHYPSLVKPAAPTPMTTLHLTRRGGSARSRWEHVVPNNACSRTATSESEPRRQNLYQSNTASYRPRGPRRPPTVRGASSRRVAVLSAASVLSPTLASICARCLPSRCRKLRTARPPLLIGPGYTWGSPPHSATPASRSLVRVATRFSGTPITRDIAPLSRRKALDRKSVV